MANWSSRLILGAAVVVLAPISARLAVTGDPGTRGGSSGVQPLHEGVVAGLHPYNKNNASSPDDLTDPEVARTVSKEETRLEARRTLCDFLVLYGLSKKLPEPHERSGGLKICTDPQPGSVEAMIAILPDPARTHLALRFDRAIDDLENSAQRLGWRFHRAWMPWPDSQAPAADRWQDRMIDEQMEEVHETEPGLLLFRNQDAEIREEAREQQPPPGGKQTPASSQPNTYPKKPMVVLVVGDSPTRGVNDEQFEQAVTIWRSLHTEAYCAQPVCVKGEKGQRRLTILGPSFSGSGDSLKSLLTRNFAEPASKAPCDAVRIAIASGTMTSADQLTSLHSPGPCFPTDAVTFGADMQYLQSQLLLFLDHHLPPGTIGIAGLTEQESQFGAQSDNYLLAQIDSVLNRLVQQKQKAEAAIEQLQEKLKKGSKLRARDRIKFQAQLVNAMQIVAQTPDSIKPEQNLVYFLDGLTAGTKRDLPNVRRVKTAGIPSQPGIPNHDCYIAPRVQEVLRDRPELLNCEVPRPDGRIYFQFTFPREISVLRKAYEQNGILGFGRTEATTPQTGLHLSFEENSGSSDTVDSYAGAQGASSMEQRMATLAATLEKEKIGVAVLSATDVLDEIFVARYLRTHAPSVSIVILDADLLFLGGGTDTSLDGAYVVSPYPLIPKNGLWSADRESPLDPTPALAESQGDQGIANAANYLLCAGDWSSQVSSAGHGCGWRAREGFDSSYLWLNEYEPPFPVDSSSDNDFALQPPLWLSVIGHGSFQPISLIDIDQRDRQLGGSRAETLPRLGNVKVGPDGKEIAIPATHPSGIGDEPLAQAYVICFVLILLLALHLSACVLCRLDRGFAWAYAAADEKPWLGRLTIQMGLNLLGIYAISLLWFHASEGFRMQPPWPWEPGALSTWSQPETLPWLSIVVVLAQALLVWLCGYVAWRSAAGARSALRHWLLVVLSLAAGCATAWLADTSLWRFLAPIAPSERNFFFYRSAYPLDGASPLLPMLLMLGALTLWLRGRLSKLTFYGYRIPQLPAPDDTEHSGAALRVADRCPRCNRVGSLNRLLGGPIWDRKETARAIEIQLAAITFFWRAMGAAWRAFLAERQARGAAAANQIEPGLWKKILEHDWRYFRNAGWGDWFKTVNWLKLRWLLVSIALVSGVLALGRQFGPHSLALSNFDRLIDALAFLVAVTIVHNLAVAFVSWRMLRGACLQPLKQSPVRWGFTWVRGFSWKRLWTSPPILSAEGHLEYVMRNIEADQRGRYARQRSPAVRAYGQLVRLYMQGPRRRYKQRQSRAAASAHWAELVARRTRRLYAALSREAADRIASLRPQWKTDFGPLTGPDPERGMHQDCKSPARMTTAGDAPDQPQPEDCPKLQRMADEEFVAMVYLSYIRAVLVQIRDRIGTSAGLYILLLWTLTGYPWMNRHGILLQMSALLALLAFVAIMIYAEMQKDDILSRTTETRAGELDGEFFSKILSVVGIPLLTLVASQFPEFSNAIFSWLVPGLSSAK